MATEYPMSMDYDAQMDVLRVRMGELTEDTVAVPMEDLTLLVGPSLDRVVGIDILCLRPFVARFVADELVPKTLEGEDFFMAAAPHLEALMQLFARNLGPIAKDTVALWDEMAAKMAAELEAAGE